jgi:hypothetical protein
VAEMGVPKPFALTADSTCADGCCTTPVPPPVRGAGWHRAARTGPAAGLGVAGVDGAAEGAIGLWQGFTVGSIALIGWALGSAVEGLASVIVVSRFTGERTLSDTAERRAQKAVAVSFWLLAPYVAIESVRDLVSGHRAEATVLGMLLAASSLIVMPVLGYAKQRLGTQLGSGATVGEGIQNYLCAGVRTKVFLFTLRLSCSGRAVHKAFGTQGQEAFLDGHQHAFKELGGVPFDKIRYDNLKSAVSRVLFGRNRTESDRWVLFRSHMGFDAFYCQPGVGGAHEKGGVEGEGGRFRPHVSQIARGRTETRVHVPGGGNLDPAVFPGPQHLDLAEPAPLVVVPADMQEYLRHCSVGTTSRTASGCRRFEAATGCVSCSGSRGRR